MSGRLFIMTIAVALVCCCFSFFACTNKKYADADTRVSADWVKDAVVYEVYLRSFSKEGTFKALEARIPELKKLGVTIVSLLPIHPIGEFNRRGSLGSPYAVNDFYAVNPEFGTIDDFKSLVNTAHLQDLKIIIDLTINQAAWDSQLLIEHPDWFMQNKEGAIVSPRLDWNDVAKLDYNQHEPRKYMIAMMKYWIKEIDIDGFRCIGAELVPTDFWNVARKEIDKIKPVLMISESALPEHHLAAFDVTYSWDMYSTLTSIIDMNTPVTVMNDSLYAEASQFPKGSLHLRFITPREENRDDTPAVEKFTPQGMRAATVLMFTISGVPSIYNGEEAGYCGRLDLFNKVDIDWSKGLEERQFYERLSALRFDHPALRRGSYTLIQNTENTRVYSFFRASGSDSVLVVINFSKEKKEANLHMPVGSSVTWKDLFSGIRFQTEDEHISVTVVPWGSLVLVPASERKIQ